MAFVTQRSSYYACSHQILSGLASLLALPLSEIIMICRLYKLFDLDYIQRCGDLSAP